MARHQRCHQRARTHHVVDKALSSLRRRRRRRWRPQAPRGVGNCGFPQTHPVMDMALSSLRRRRRPRPRPRPPQQHLQVLPDLSQFRVSIHGCTQIHRWLPAKLKTASS